MPVLRVLAAALAVVLVSVGCSGGESAPSTSSVDRSLERSAAEYAASADRATDATAFESVGVDRIAGVVVEICTGLGVGAVPAYVEALAPGAVAADREIMAEVLVRGALQVCPDRAAVDLTSIYLEPIVDVVDQVGASDAYDEYRVIRAAPVACAAFASGGAGEGALLAVIEDLFDVAASDFSDLDGVLRSDQGVVAGAVLSASTALFCPDRVDEVNAFMESL